MNSENVVFCVLLFIPCFIIVILTLREVYWSCIEYCRWRNRLIRKKKRIHCIGHSLHSIITIWILSLQSSKFIQTYLKIDIITASFITEFISFCLLIFMILHYQTQIQSLMPLYVCSRHPPAKLTAVFTLILFLSFVGLFICHFIINRVQYLIFALCCLIILVFIIIAYLVYFEPIKESKSYIDLLVNDLVESKRKQQEYINNLERDKIDLLCFGWIRSFERSQLLIPIDIQYLICNYIFYQNEERLWDRRNVGTPQFISDTPES